MHSSHIRTLFFSFFKQHNHTIVPSSSLIPAQDPSLLFTNAGMNQFKDVFLNLEQRSYKRAASIQKCVRAGGKHNDLDNVGFTARHLTFFEMMGNFSFGDYFKKEAIQFAWQFLTTQLGITSENLHVTVYRTDDESYNFWRNLIGIPEQRLHRLGEKENFWQMGDVGPCGPCTEIHLDRGPAFGCKDIASCGPACDCDRFLEIWNLVFMQYNRQPDGTLVPLAQTGVDTGMGLERLCVVMQHVDSVYKTDLFAGILEAIETLTHKKYENQDALGKAAFHVLADHIRSSCLLIADGCTPSNDGRGYVLRKIIRRAALFAQKLHSENIFPRLVPALIASLNDVYPELQKSQTHILHVLTNEVDKFAANLSRGQNMLEQYVQKNSANKIIPGDQAFKLYDTYGFPLELIILIARDHGCDVDVQGFDQCMQKQQEISGKKTVDILDQVAFDVAISTEFTGYRELETKGTILALVIDHQIVPAVPAFSKCFVIVDRSPFFIVGGGQVPDQGVIHIGQHIVPILQVRYINGRIAAQIEAPEQLSIGMHVISVVDSAWRSNAMKNHTATHLLQAALIEVLGQQIKQAGSLVHPDYLRFDFSYHEAPTIEQLTAVETIVNQKIQADIPVTITYGSLKEAQQKGALAFFGEKYNPEQVRMVEVPNFSIELCGGTHVPSTGHIGVFKITESTALSAGVRRLVAVTGPQAVMLFQQIADTVKGICQEFKIKKEDVINTVLKIKDQNKQLTNQIKDMQQEFLMAQLTTLVSKAREIRGIIILVTQLETQTIEHLRTAVTKLIEEKPNAVCFLAGSSDSQGKQPFVVAFGKSVIQKIDTKIFTQWLLGLLNCKGGGSLQMIQGVASKLINIDQLEQAIVQWIDAAIEN